MDRRERFNDSNVAIETALAGAQAGIWTAMPGIVQSFDADERTCSVQVAIQPRVLAQDGTESNVSISVLIHCPVVFPRGGGFELTFPLAEGDESLVVFASRCIDSWWESGGVQPQAELRMHDLSDGFLLAGCYSKAHKPSAPASTTGAQLRNADGTMYLELSATGILIKGNAIVDGNLQVTGNITWPHGTMHSGAGGVVIDTDLSATGEVKAGHGTLDEVALKTHLHAGVAVGGGSTAPPTGGT